jgi:hypothetical protein
MPMNVVRTLTRTLRVSTLGIVFCGFAFPANAQTFKTQFESGYDGWIADFVDFLEADSSRRKLEHVIEPIQSIEPSMTALRMKGMPSGRYPQSDSTGDLFPFLRKRITGLSPNTEYRITFRMMLATAYGQFSQDTLWIKAGASTVEPRKVRGDNKYTRINISKGPARGPGADMDTLGCIGYTGMGHSFPEPRSLDNAGHPFKVKTDASGSLWVTVGAEYLPKNGVEGLEFNVGSIQIDMVAGSTALQPRMKRGWKGDAGILPGIFRFGAAEWNLTGRRMGRDGR